MISDEPLRLFKSTEGATDFSPNSQVKDRVAIFCALKDIQHNILRPNHFDLALLIMKSKFANFQMVCFQNKNLISVRFTILRNNKHNNNGGIKDGTTDSSPAQNRFWVGDHLC